MKKKSCDGCRALHRLGVDQHCSLGYPVKLEDKRIYSRTNAEYIGKYYIAIPLVECPKPRTHAHMARADFYKKAA